MKVASGTAAFLAGTVAALVPPVLVVGFDQPIGLGLGLGFGLGGALFGVLGLARGRPASSLDDLPEARASTARALIEEGQAALDQLRATSRVVRDSRMREELKLLVMKGERVLREVRDDPACAMQVRRLFTFYLPNAANVAEGWRALESKSEPAPDLEVQTRDTVAALNDAFTRFADEMHEPKMQALDLDLKVLNSALKEDLAESR
jgi:hypothetical protein